MVAGGSSASMGRRSVRWEVVVVRNRDEEVAGVEAFGRRIRGGRGIRAVGEERRRAGVFGYHLVVSSYLFCFLFLLKKKIWFPKIQISGFSKFKLVKMLR